MITRILYHVVYVDNEGERLHAYTGSREVYHLMVTTIGDNPKVIMMIAWEETLVMEDVG